MAAFRSEGGFAQQRRNAAMKTREDWFTCVTCDKLYICTCEEMFVTRVRGYLCAAETWVLYSNENERDWFTNVTCDKRYVRKSL